MCPLIPDVSYRAVVDIGADLLGGDDAGAERADAARNRARILAAAADVFAARDPRTVTMEHIATAAGVGRGTLYRRYPNTAAIAVALAAVASTTTAPPRRCSLAATSAVVESM